MEEKNFYEVVAEFRMETEDRNGNVRIKRRKERYLVESSSTEHANHKVHEFLSKEVSDQYNDWSVVSVKQSNVSEVIK